MRIILYLSFALIFSAFTAQAQTTTKPNSAPPPQTAEKPASETANDANEEAAESFDLESFFKKGEENAKKGMGCEAPAEPIS